MKLLLKDRLTSWLKLLFSARLTTEAAALSFFVLLAFPAALVLLVTGFGLIGSDAAIRDALSLLEPVLGEEGLAVVSQFVAQSSAGATGTVSAVTAGVLVIVTLGAMLQLQETLNALQGHAGTVYEWRWTDLITGRLRALALMTVASLVLGGTVVLSGMFMAGLHGMIVIQTGWFVWAVNQGLLLVVCWVLFALLYRYLPAGSTAWRSVFEGAAVGAVLFSVGREVLWGFLIRGEWLGFYGTSASVLAIGVWVYYSALIFFAGGLLAYRSRD